MRKIAELAVLFILIVACGGGPGGTKNIGESITGLPAPATQPGVTGLPVVLPYTPGSYFKVLKEVGSAKDTRVLEFQFLSDKRFILTQTSFSGGDLTKVFFHKKTGTYSESSGTISYAITSDTCGNLKFQTTYFSGDRNNVVSVMWNGNSSRFYSYSTWTLPSDISSHIVDAVEDFGCKVFQD